jgi:hypothetical protein
MGDKDTLLTTKEFASRSGLTVTQVTKLLRAKKIKGHKQSGRWMIPASELESSPQTPTPSRPAQTRAAKPAQAPRSAPTYSVSEFSALTYLTEAGVLQWLKAGRLRGTQTPDGQWQVDAASLELPMIRHLRRS